MTKQQLIDAYPGCPDAVLWHEEEDVGMETMWRMIRALCENGMSLEDALGYHVEFFRRFQGDLYRQVEHPDFKRYFAAKIGAM